jgi:hypothetical protein
VKPATAMTRTKDKENTKRSIEKSETRIASRGEKQVQKEGL